MVCFPIKVSAVRPSSALQNLPLCARKKSLRKRSGCGLRYAGKGPHNKTRKIIAASNRALREAEAVLKRR